MAAANGCGLSAAFKLKGHKAAVLSCASLGGSLLASGDEVRGQGRGERWNVIGMVPRPARWQVLCPQPRQLGDDLIGKWLGIDGCCGQAAEQGIPPGADTARCGSRQECRRQLDD